MSGISLSPKRALAYPGTRLTFVDESSVAYCFGSAVRITHLLPDKGDGDGEYLWEENEWAGMSAVAANWRAGKLAVCPAGRINPAIHIYSYPGMVLQGTLLGGTDLRYVDVAFSREGTRVAAFGNRTDHLATVWNVKKDSSDIEALTGEKVVEAVLPGDMSFLSFNPADSDQLCIGGASGLYFWRVDNLVDNWVISPIKAKAPASPSKGRRRSFTDDDEGGAEHVTGAAGNLTADTNGDDNAATACLAGITSAVGCPYSHERAQRSATADAAGAVAAAEIVQLESLVTMGDGKHDAYTCHCWGLENTLWAVNEAGQLTCFDANTGKYSSCTALSRAADSAKGGEWRAVGLLMTKTHIIVTGSGGSVEWYTLPIQPDVHLEVEFSIQLRANDGTPNPAVTMACSPLYDKMVVGSGDGSLHSVFMDIERHTVEPGVPASGVNILKTFHTGKVVALACLRPTSSDSGEESDGVLISGGEDGTVRVWTAARGKLCGSRIFLALSQSRVQIEDDTHNAGENGISLDDRIETPEEDKESPGGQRGDVPIPVCALSSCRGQPLLAVGLYHGAVHMLFVKQASAYDVDVIDLWKERFYRGPVSQLCFHPSKPLLAVASSDDRAVHVVNFHNPMGEFVICGVGEAAQGKGGVNGLMWRGNDIIFSTDDCLVCALPIKSERRARPNRCDPLLWAFRTPTPLHGMRPHPQIDHGPFFAVSADMRVLQVLPALPEKGIPSTVDGSGDPKLLAPLDTLEAHQKGAAVMAASPDGRFMATGGADGLVCLWMVYENQVELLNSALVHAGPVISLAFAANSAHLFSTSLDGTVFGLLLEGLQEGTRVQPPPTASTLERLADRRAAKQKNLRRIIERLDVEPWRQESHTEARDSADIEPDAAGRAQQKVVGKFKDRLGRIVARNETLPELEMMNRDEFVVDVAGRDRKVAANHAAANKLRDEIRIKNLSKELVKARIKAECWDSMEVQKKEVQCMQLDGVFVENFAIRQRNPEELALVRKVKQLRALELRDVRRGTYSATRAWPGLLDEVPSDISWMVNEGSLAPVVDVVQDLREKAAAGAGSITKGGSGGKGAGAGDDGAKGGSGSNKTSVKKNVDDGSGAEDHDGEEHDDPIATLETLEAADESDPVYLLYPPLALRTPRQKRTQIVLLGELILDVQAAFNRHLDKLHSAKEDCMDKVEERNTRIQEILLDLGSEETFFKPKWLDLEQPEEVFNVENEMTLQPYESEADRELRRKAEEEKRRREEEAKGANDKFRALEDMMHGTLELKQEGLTADAVKRPEWMDETALEVMTEQHKKELEEYEAKLKEVQEEQAKHRKALELELKKLRTEVSDLLKSFDDKVKELFQLRVQVQMFTASKELLVTRLAMGIVEREDDDVTMEKLDKALGELSEKRALAQERLEGYRLHVEQCREEIEALQAEDRLMERNFKKEIQEAASNPIDMADMMAQLVQLYKLRDHSTMSAGGSSGYRGSATGMSNRTSYRKSQSSRRTPMRESAMGRSKRKRSSRVSSGGGSMRASHGLGPLQEAMRQATNREKAAKIAEKDPFGPVDEQLDKNAASEEVNTAAMAQDLEYPGFEVEDQVWNRLLELRGSKIHKEMELKKQQRLFAIMKRKLEALQADCDSVDSQVTVIESRKRAISERAYLAEKNIEVLVKLKQGQDEVPRGAVVTEYVDSVLIPSAIVNHTNAEIRKLGGEKVRTLNKIKQFRKNINLMQWGHTYLDEQVKDREAYYIDLQLLRVTKKLQAVLKGDRGEKDKELGQKTEARVEIMEKAHESKSQKARQANAKIALQLQERLDENRRVSGQLIQLASSVKIREAIYRSHMEASGGEINPAQQAAGRMKRITTRRRLVDLARAQTGEIEALKAELDRLRQRTFPSFAHAARNRMLACPDERL